MTLIEGIGDEVTHFFIGLFAVIIVVAAWWTTNISEQRHVRTVLLLERRRHFAQRRLTNHTETVTITEGTSIAASSTEDPPQAESSIALESSPISTETTEDKPPEASCSNSEESHLVGNSEQESIIETMDSDAFVLRQRRLAFYGNWNNGSEDTSHPSEPQVSSSEDLPQGVEDDIEEVESKTTDQLDESEEQVSSGNQTLEETKAGITIKLKYINDDLKLVDGKLEELLGDFKRRHFQPEITSNKIVRLIFNGQVLQPDTQTLSNCGLFDNCVVHCLIHQKRAQSADSLSGHQESRREGYSFPNTNGIPNFNNNNQNREWDLGNFLFAFISFILLAAWYFRYVYAHLYTVTATVGLILITGIFTIVLVGMYFPDNEHLPNPTIRIARERVPVVEAQQ